MFAADVVIMDGVCCVVACMLYKTLAKWLVAKQAGNVNVVAFVHKMALSLY